MWGSWWRTQLALCGLFKDLVDPTISTTSRLIIFLCFIIFQFLVVPFLLLHGIVVFTWKLVTESSYQIFNYIFVVKGLE